MDGGHFGRGIFLEYAKQMATLVTYLHDEKYMMHTDLHPKNWLVLEDGNLMLIDFGCAKLLGKDGIIPAGTKFYFYDGFSPPEMQMKPGTSWAQGNAVTGTDFSFNGDIFILGFSFTVMLNFGDWMKPLPPSVDEDIKDLIGWMKTDDAKERP